MTNHTDAPLIPAVSVHTDAPTVPGISPHEDTHTDVQEVEYEDSHHDISRHGDVHGDAIEMRTHTDIPHGDGVIEFDNFEASPGSLPSHIDHYDTPEISHHADIDHADYHADTH